MDSPCEAWPQGELTFMADLTCRLTLGHEGPHVAHWEFEEERPPFGRRD